MNEDIQAAPSVDQPTQAGALTPEPPRLALYTVDTMGPERILSLESIVAEHYAHFERRQVNGRWMWRQPRNPAIVGRPAWVPQPPSLLREGTTLDMFDVLIAREGLDWMATSAIVQVEAENKRCYLMGLGRTTDSCHFQGIADLRVFTDHFNLGAMILLQRLSKRSIDDVRTQIFPHSSAIMRAVPTAPVQ